MRHFSFNKNTFRAFLLVPLPLALIAAPYASAGTGTPPPHALQSEAQVSLSRYAGPPGSVIEITGHGFGPGEPITIHADRGALTLPWSADPHGNFQASLAIPRGWVRGGVTLSITGEHSLAQKQATYFVTGS